MALVAAALPSLAGELRAPAVPLVTIDPYTSCWSMNDRLTDDWPRHWTGQIHAMCGMLRVNGKTLRWMGTCPEAKDAMQQLSVDVQATRTIYRFAGAGVELTVTFTSPLLMDDLDVLSRPVTYVDYELTSQSGDPGPVQIYFDATAEWAVNQVSQQVAWSRLKAEGLHAMALGTVDQKILAARGDDLRIDWGHLLVAAPQQQTSTAIASDKLSRSTFVQTGGAVAQDDASKPRVANDAWPVLSVVSELRLSEPERPAKAHVLIGYDDVESIEYFGRKLRAWWRRNESSTPEAMFVSAERDHDAVIARCARFDQQLLRTAAKSGPPEYVDLCRVAYRQAIAAHKLVADVDGKPLFFSKENFSNGSIGTVDVTYPSAPLFLLYNPTLLKGMLEPIFFYRESGKWTKPFAPHDVGTYPQANGQTYGEDMPVEECGNMLILAAAIGQVEGGPAYAKQHWTALTEWAAFLKLHGFDPENQLCTDDFAGHLAHNANLSVKAIVALGAYGKLARELGQADAAEEYLSLARKLAGRWIEAAEDGDHYSLTFDKKGTWSQKYNLVWDHWLGLDLFPPQVVEREIAFYVTHQQPYGLPLDSRKTYTKSDWILWTAAMAPNRADFDALVMPVWRFANETSDRIPLSDWHETTNSKSVGFRARSVVGGYFMKMLLDAPSASARETN